MKEHLMFAAKVALAILIINQLPVVPGIINKNYLGIGTGA